MERLACFDITSFNKVTLQDDTALPGGGLPATRKAEVRPGSSVVTDSGALFGMDRHLRRLRMGLLVVQNYRNQLQ